MEWGKILISVLAVVLIIQIIAPGTLQDLVGIAPVAQPTPGVTQVPGTTSCAETSVTMDTDFTEYGIPGTAAGGTTQYWDNGIAATGLTTSDTATVAPGHTIVMVVESRNNAATNYYGKGITFTVPCGTFQAGAVATPLTTVGYNGYKAGGVSGSELIRNVTSLTITGETAGVASMTLTGACVNNVTVGTGGIGDVDLELKGEAYRGIAPSGSLYVILDGAKGNWSIDKFTMMDKVSNTPLVSIPTPQAYTTALGGLSQTKTFKIAGCPRVGETNCDLKMGIHIEAKSTSNPATTDGSGLNLTFMTDDFDRNTIDSGITGIMFGPEDNVGGVSGPTLAGTATAPVYNLCIG